MNENLHDDFMKLGDMSDIDNRILAEAGRDDLLDRMEEEKDKETERKAPWTRDAKEHWYIYALLGLSFLLTETLAIYLGMAPKLIADASSPTGTMIHFNTDIGHLLTALVYMLVFPIVTEVAFERAWKKFVSRETGNRAQAITMVIAIVASIISMVGTGVAGGYVILGTLGSIGFIEVPSSVQGYLIWMIPILLAGFAVLHGIYKASSRFEKQKKLVEEQTRNAELADNLRMRQIEQAGKRAIRAAAIRSFERAVEMGLLSQEQADSARAQGMSLADLERKLNRDITGEGKIGDTSGLHRPALPDNARPARLPDNYGPEWKNSTDIAPALDAYAWSCQNCEGSNAPHTRECQWCGQPRTNGSAVTASAGLPPAHPQRQAPRGLYQEPPYHPVSLDPKERKNGRNP